MAEIRVEKKRGTGNWLWLVLLLLVVAAIAIYLWQSGAFGTSDATDVGALGIQQQFAALEAAWHATNLG